jgi:hypothetical protein
MTPRMAALVGLPVAGRVAVPHAVMPLPPGTIPPGSVSTIAIPTQDSP